MENTKKYRGFIFKEQLLTLGLREPKKSPAPNEIEIRLSWRGYAVALQMAEEPPWSSLVEAAGNLPSSNGQGKPFMVRYLPRGTLYRTTQDRCQGKLLVAGC